MAILPLSSSRGTDHLLSRCPQGSLRGLAIYGQCCFRADQRADCTSGAALPVEIGRMIAFRGQPVRVQREHMLRTGLHAQLASLAVQIVDFNPSLYGHSSLLHYRLVASEPLSLLRRSAR